MAEVTYAKGLAGVIAAESTICNIDGEAGLLSYRGYAIQDLGQNSTFSESAYLLLYGSLPSSEQLTAFEKRLASCREIDASIYNLFRALDPSTHPMIALQAAVAAHGGIGPVEAGHNDANFTRAIELISRFPTMIAAWQRIKAGLEPVAPRSDLGHGQNFLYMLSGQAPDAETGHIFDVCLILHMEHGFNASTFTGRVTASTLAPMDAAVAAAVGSLYGPLHGGANEAVLDMLAGIDTADVAEAWTMNALANKTKIMGMGHRVYKAKDPRSHVLESFLARLAEKTGGNENYRKLKVIETTMAREVGKKGIWPNVDFFSGSLYELLEIEVELFTPIFALARIVGWTAHILEQWEDNRIYRPDAYYTGANDLTWKPFDAR